MQCVTLSKGERVRLLPFVLGYYALKGLAIDQISSMYATRIDAWAECAEIVHNGRIGREPFSYASLRVARQRDVPFIFTPFHHPRWVGWNYTHYINLYRRADTLIALTETERRTLAMLGVDEARIHVLGTGPVLANQWDAERFRERHGLGDQRIVLFLGQKYRYKGIAALLAAAPLVWRACPDTAFVFIGPRTAYSIKLFPTPQDHRIVEIGPIGVEEKTSALAACDVLCVPSTQESFGSVYTEAWMMGKPVIGCGIPAVREIIAEGEDGYCVQQEPAEIADRLIYLLGHVDVGARLGVAGRQKVMTRFTWERLVEKLQDVYCRVLDGRYPE